MDVLEQAIQGSSYVCSVWEENTLLALIRCLSDDASIMYLQDVLVHPRHQQMSIGRTLVEKALHRYRHVRQKVLLTDNRPEQLRFYKSLGYTNIDDFETLNAFVKFDG